MTWFREASSAVVLLSGGVDSGVLAAIAYEALGSQAVAVTGVSASLAESERQDIIRLVRTTGVSHIEVVTHEGDDPAYVRNDQMRCYVCKQHLFRAAAPIAQERHAVLVVGSHVDDLGDWRPGMLAAEHAGVRSPYLELGLGKDAIRTLARELGLDWLAEKPAAACLASRIPQGSPVRAPALRVVERFEQELRGLGFRDFRVRHHGRIARLEVSRRDFSKVAANAEQITAIGSQLGFEFTTLDLVDLERRRASRGSRRSEVVGWLGSRPSSGTRAS